MVLFKRGRSLISNDQTKLYKKDYCNLFLIFSFVFAFYAGIHSLYIYKQSHGELWILLTPLLSLFLMLKPSSVPRFIMVACASFAGIWSAFPSASNSTLLTLTLVSIILCAYAGLVLRKRNLHVDCADLFAAFAPGGRALLMILYFYGVFQKVNTGFMDPNFSCATEFLNHFRFLPQSFIDHSIVQYTAIYGTFVVETLIALCLLIPKTRYAGIVMGGAFHLMLSFNTYQYFHTFTTLAILMHFLYLDPRTLSRWQNSPIGRWFDANHSRYKQVIFGWLVFMGIYIFFWLSGTSIYDTPLRAFADIAWIPIGFSLWFFAIAYDHKVAGEVNYNFPSRYFYFSPALGVNIIVILYFFQCLSPYFGLKSEQALNMYSNLRVTYEQSNHYIFRAPLNIFPFLKGSVKIVETDDRFLKQFIKKEHVLFARHFFDYLARHPDVKAVYIYEGQRYDHRGASAKQIKQWKLPYLLHKLQSYNSYPEDFSDMRCKAMHT